MDNVFCPNDLDDIGHKSPILVKKLEKGDDFWATEKVILGWLINTLAKTIFLPPNCQERLHQLLDTMLCLLGELQSMQLALPGSAGCFSFLQDALRASNQRIRITELVKDQIQDSNWLASS